MWLGHARLAIIDLSPGGHQPMTSASGRYTITFNGEIFNYAAIRAELEAAGHAPRWRGGSDTEVLLAAVDAWGIKAAIRRCIGMFAFAVWDATSRELTLVRDRVGVKPLYFARCATGLCFGSELKSLRQVPGFDATIDRRSVARFLRSSCVPGTDSIFAGTAKVSPGCLLRFKNPNDDPLETRYWDPVTVALNGRERRFAGTEADAAETLDALLRDAIRLRMISDVPLGAFLSGGIDSSTVAALMQVQSSRPVHTFSIANESPTYDEAEAAKQVAAHLGTKHTSQRVTAQDALAVIPTLPQMFDEPFADSSQIPTHLVSRLARRDVTVALSGDGGDEVFGGYARHVWGPLIWRATGRVPARLRCGAAGVLGLLSPATWDRVLDRGGVLIPRIRIGGIRVHKLRAVLAARTPEEMYSALTSHWVAADRVMIDPPATEAEGAEAIEDLGVAEAMMLSDLRGYLCDDVLTKVDRASMAVGLEAREPLLDHRVIEFAWSLPLPMKIRGSTGKRILRRVLSRYVPEALVSGAKMGFGVPLADWLRGPLRDWAEALLDRQRLLENGLEPSVVHRRWRELLAGTEPWEHHLWDVLMLQAWTLAQCEPPSAPG